LQRNDKEKVTLKIKILNPERANNKSRYKWTPKVIRESAF